MRLRIPLVSSFLSLLSLLSRSLHLDIVLRSLANLLPLLGTGTQPLPAPERRTGYGSGYGSSSGYGSGQAWGSSDRSKLELVWPGQQLRLRQMLTI